MKFPSCLIITCFTLHVFTSHVSAAAKTEIPIWGCFWVDKHAPGEQLVRWCDVGSKEDNINCYSIDANADSPVDAIDAWIVVSADDVSERFEPNSGLCPKLPRYIEEIGYARGGNDVGPLATVAEREPSTWGCLWVDKGAPTERLVRWCDIGSAEDNIDCYRIGANADGPENNVEAWIVVAADVVSERVKPNSGLCPKLPELIRAIEPPRGEGE